MWYNLLIFETHLIIYFLVIYKMETFSLKEIKYNEEFIEIDEQIVFVKKCPSEQLVIENYNKLPEIVGLKKLTKEESLNFSSEIIDDQRRVMSINGFQNPAIRFGGNYCDYCRSEIENTLEGYLSYYKYTATGWWQNKFKFTNGKSQNTMLKAKITSVK